MTAQRTVTVLGATGSIGASTLDLVARAPDRFAVHALTANSDAAKLAVLAKEHRAKVAVVADQSALPALREALSGTAVEALGGAQAVSDVAGQGADLTVAGIVGCAGLPSVISAVSAGKTVVIANKEPLVSAGEVVLAAAAASGATLLPADSEHNAIFQCFDANRPKGVRRIILTASGGPFRDMTRETMRSVTPEQACAHPVWSMGAKISVDSATLMNKGLELIEAARLFPVHPNQIEIVIHRQSVVHSLVDYIDGSVLAQLGPPDMRTPIAYCLAWPERMETPIEPLDLAKIGRLDFEAPDEVRFPALRLAREALNAGGARPAILNAANEIAVAAFLSRRIGFLSIADVVAATLDSYDPPLPREVDAVVEVDRKAREVAASLIDGDIKGVAA